MNANVIIGGVGILLLIPVIYYVNSIANNLCWLKNGVLSRHLARYDTAFTAAGAGCILGGVGTILFAAGVNLVPVWIWLLPFAISYILVLYVIHRAVSEAEWRDRDPIVSSIRTAWQ